MKVLITNRIPKTVMGKYEKEFMVDYHDSMEYLSKGELKKRVETADILVCPLSEQIDREVIDAAKNLKLIANYGAGFDNVDIAYAKEKNIIVTNTPASASTKSTAELTMGLLIDLLRNITASQKDIVENLFEGWKPVYGMGETLEGKTLGIIGLGKIGREVARKAKAFDMQVIYWSRHEKTDVDFEYRPLEEVLEKSDVITLHTAYTKELYHLIDEKAFRKMKDTAYLINASRGPVVDEKALIKALNSEEIRGAALDVYEFEPHISEELKAAKNILLAPHLGNATDKARIEMGMLTFENALALKKGAPCPNRVNE